jgi:hypothetical protein
MQTDTRRQAEKYLLASAPGREALGQAFIDIGRYIKGHEDAPVMCNGTACYRVPAGVGSDEERMAMVDAFAAENHVTAEWADGRYSATITFGPLEYEVFFLPAAKLAETEARGSYYANVQVAAA